MSTLDPRLRRAMARRLAWGVAYRLLQVGCIAIWLCIFWSAFVMMEVYQ